MGRTRLLQGDKHKMLGMRPAEGARPRDKGASWLMRGRRRPALADATGAAPIEIRFVDGSRSDQPGVAPGVPERPAAMASAPGPTIRCTVSGPVKAKPRTLLR